MKKHFGNFLLVTSVILTPMAHSEIAKTKSVFITDVKKIELFDIYAYPAKLASEKQSYLIAQSQGQVEKIYKEVGEVVKKNDLVFTIKHDDPSYDYKSQKITSPIDGVIANQQYEEGSKVSAGDKLGLVIDPEKIKIVIELTLKDIDIIKVGTIGKLSYPGTPLEVDAIVSHLSPIIDPMSGTAQAKLKIVSSTNFKIGTMAVVTFKIGNRKGFELTKDAIVYLGKKTYVRVVDDKNKVSRQEVEIKPRSSSTVEVIKGISEGQKVVIKSSGFLQDGIVVKIENPTEETK